MNKNGWGLRVELAFILLFVICIVVSTIGLHKLGLLKNDNGVYTDKDEEVYKDVNFDYNSLENKVSDAASKYYDDNYGYTNDTVVISTSKLKGNGYLSDLVDGRGRECKGYAMVLGNANIVSYIKCSMYKTVGYNSDYE